MPEQARIEAGAPGPVPPVRPAPPTPSRPRIKLDRENIARLHKESEALQKRLAVEEDKHQEEASLLSTPAEPLPEPEPIPASPTIGETPALPPGVDEEWQNVLQHWQPVHWEILDLLCQQKAVQLTRAKHKNHRPVSQLIDEINAPVDEHFGDLLIDPDTQTLAPHLRATAENLVNWHNSSH